MRRDPADHDTAPSSRRRQLGATTRARKPSSRNRPPRLSRYAHVLPIDALALGHALLAPDRRPGCRPGRKPCRRPLIGGENSRFASPSGDAFAERDYPRSSENAAKACFQVERDPSARAARWFVEVSARGELVSSRSLRFPSVARSRSSRMRASDPTMARDHLNADETDSVVSKPSVGKMRVAHHSVSARASAATMAGRPGHEAEPKRPRSADKEMLSDRVRARRETRIAVYDGGFNTSAARPMWRQDR